MAKHSDYVFAKYNTTTLVPELQQGLCRIMVLMWMKSSEAAESKNTSLLVLESIIFFFSFTQTVRYTMILSSFRWSEERLTCLWLFHRASEYSQMQLPHLGQPQELRQVWLQLQCCCLTTSRPGGREQPCTLCLQMSLCVEWLMLKCSTSFRGNQRHCWQRVESDANHTYFKQMKLKP